MNRSDRGTRSDILTDAAAEPDDEDEAERNSLFALFIDVVHLVPAGTQQKRFPRGSEKQQTC